MSALMARLARPVWRPALLWVAWIVAVLAGYVLYGLPVGAVQLVLGLDRVLDPLHPAELATVMLVIGAVLCGAGYGSTIGLAEWLVLRTRLKRAGWWVLATVAGYASTGLLLTIPSIFQPGWREWAITLIISGKMHWLARVQPEWPLASWPAGAVTLVLFGVALGIAQWLVLRGRVHQAGWWVALTAGGWLVPAALSPLMSWPDYVSASWEVPAMAQATGIAWLLRRPT